MERDGECGMLEVGDNVTPRDTKRGRRLRRHKIFKNISEVLLRA